MWAICPSMMAPTTGTLPIAAGMCFRVNCIPEPCGSNWYTNVPARCPSYSSTIRSVSGGTPHQARRLRDMCDRRKDLPRVPCTRNTLSRVSRIFTTSFASAHLHYVTKVEWTGTTNVELGQVIPWLTGFDETALGGQLDAITTVEDSFEEARVNPSHPAIRHPDQVVRLLRAPCAPENVWSRRNGGARW